MTRRIAYAIVKPNSTAEASVRRIQEQYKKFFFVPFLQLERAISDGSILAALDASTVVGYVWFHIRESVVRIRYLAVDPTRSRKGVGRSLVDEVKRRNKNAYGICLSCRTDYPGWNFWKRLGFSVVRNRPGRAKAGSTLTDFYFELSPLPLFHGEKEQVETTLVAVDANVFFDITDDSRPHHIESAGLVADWISADVELCVTAAIHEDLARSTDSFDHGETLKGWRKVEADPAAFRCIHEQLVTAIGKGETPQDDSDRNHLSHAIAENVTAFITRDENLLKYSDSVYESFGITLQRPSDFIVNLDVVANQSRYDRHDLTSVRLSHSRLQSLDQVANLDDFRRANEREKMLRGRIREWLAHPDESTVRMISSDGEAQGIYVTTRTGARIDVPLFRCSRKIAERRRGRSLARYLASSLRKQSNETHVIHVTDEHVLNEHGSALSEAGFLQTQDGLYKISLSGIWNPADAANAITRIGRDELLPPELVDWFNERFDTPRDADSFLRLEKAIWPGKLNSGGIVECAIIPIRPRWARALFDPNLGQAEFWQDDADLLLNPTSVYYSGSRIGLQQGRLLWYVSHHDSFSGTKAIRACSQLTKRVIGRPLDVYRRFRHLGVYKLNDIEEISRDPRPDVLAMEFGDTELLKSPVKLDRVRSILNDTQQAFQWPTEVSETTFLDIYQTGQE